MVVQERHAIVRILGLSEMSVSHSGFYRPCRLEALNGDPRVSFRSAGAGLGKAGQNEASTALPTEVKVASPQRTVNLTAT